MSNVLIVTSFFSSTLGLSGEAAGGDTGVVGAFDFCGCGCGLAVGDCKSAAEFVAGIDNDDVEEGFCAGATAGGVAGAVEGELAAAGFELAVDEFAVCERRVQSAMPRIKISPATTINLHVDPV